MLYISNCWSTSGCLDIPFVFPDDIFTSWVVILRKPLHPTEVFFFYGQEPLRMKMMKKYGFLVILLGVCSCYSLLGETVSFFVVDKDLEMPLEGVRIIDTQSSTETYTDFNGEAEMAIESIDGRAVNVAELIGYEDKKVLLKEFDKPITIEMMMEGLVVGEELVIEAKAIGETDEEVGVSTVIEKEVIRSTAKIGVIEDVLTAVKLLPGVSYGGTCLHSRSKSNTFGVLVRI
jgi:hypothetical protein